MDDFVGGMCTKSSILSQRDLKLWIPKRLKRWIVLFLGNGHGISLGPQFVIFGLILMFFGVLGFKVNHFDNIAFRTSN